jgi:hypothetical protein
MLFDSDRSAMPSWHSELFTPDWNGEKIAIVFKRPFVVVLDLDLHGDHRAIHLETALDEEKQDGAWSPNGLDASSLRDAYRTIVTDLISQFHMDYGPPTEGMPNGEFNRQLNPNRFAINAMAEAILSEWTNTPLPKSALRQSTGLLVRAIGWGKGVPTIRRRGQVLFRGPFERKQPLTHYKAVLGSIRYGHLSSPTASKHWGYFTFPEARRLGLNVDGASRWLVDLTRRGQFLAFDANRGRLTENKTLSDKFRLQPEDAEPYKVLLPGWAFGPPNPSTSSDDLHRILSRDLRRKLSHPFGV